MGTHIILLTLEVLFIFEPMRRLIMRQISYLKLAAAQAIEAEQRAVESNKVKAQFIANMSHELRTPMLHGPILVAEDNEINVYIIETIFVDNGHEVVIPSDGQKTIDWLKNSTIHPEDILMDMQMPTMDGVTTTRYIRKKCN
jgi:PleD family two-component response regulator